MTRRLALLTLALLLATAATAQPSAPDGPAVPPAPTASTPDPAFDAARVIERTVLALRIRTLVETWPVYRTVTTASTSSGSAIATEERPVAASFETRLSTALDSIAKTESRLNRDSVRTVVQFTLDPMARGTTHVPSADALSAALSLLERYYPRTVASAPSPNPAVGTARALGDLTYTVFAPAGSDLANESAAEGAGVSFQQSLIEGTTAFLLDRARADLARSGLEKFQEELGSSPLRDAFPQTLALSGFPGAETDAFRDPRLYLAALQSSLTDDFDRLPIYVASALRNSDVMGLAPHEWELAYRAVSLVSDVQRGTHPLLALSTFAGRHLNNADPSLQSRLFTLQAISTALYAGPGSANGRSYAARRILDTLDGRQLFAVFLSAELERSGSLPGSCGGTAHSCANLVAARVASLRQTLDEIVQEVAALRESYDQIRAANPAQAGVVYADYIAVVTRAVRQVVIEAGADNDNRALRVLAEIERVLAIREAVVRRDYPGAAVHAMPYLTLIAAGAGGTQTIGAVHILDGAIGLLRQDLAAADTIRQEQAFRTARRAFNEARPAVEALTNAAAVRANTFASVSEAACGTKAGPICQDMRRLAGRYRAVSDAWEALSVEVDRDFPSAGGSASFGVAQERVRTAIRLTQEAYDAEASATQRGRSVAAIVVGGARDELDDEDLVAVRRQLQAYGAETKIGQMLVAAAALAASTSSDDVYQTLVVYSAPPSSFRDRRRRITGRRFRVALGSYVGMTGGIENVDSEWGLHAGVSLPVGIEVSWVTEGWGLGLDAVPRFIGARSFGLYVSPLNLGTFADYRLSRRTLPDGSVVGDSPAYSLEQALAPSAFATFGLTSDLPITLGFGVSYVPALRDPAGEGGALGATRVSGFLAVDVPLWIFR